MEQIYNKLVRDNIPEIIKKNGEVPVIRTLSEREYQLELFKKLSEECHEAALATTSIELLHELADIIEVSFAIAQLESKTPENLLAIARQKREQNGGFDERIMLEKVIRRS